MIKNRIPKILVKTVSGALGFLLIFYSIPLPVAFASFNDQSQTLSQDQAPLEKPANLNTESPTADPEPKIPTGSINPDEQPLQVPSNKDSQMDLNVPPEGTSPEISPSTGGTQTYDSNGVDISGNVNVGSGNTLPRGGTPSIPGAYLARHNVYSERSDVYYFPDKFSLQTQGISYTTSIVGMASNINWNIDMKGIPNGTTAQLIVVDPLVAAAAPSNASPSRWERSYGMTQNGNTWTARLNGFSLGKQYLLYVEVTLPDGNRYRFIPNKNEFMTASYDSTTSETLVAANDLYNRVAFYSHNSTGNSTGPNYVNKITQASGPEGPFALQSIAFDIYDVPRGAQVSIRYWDPDEVPVNGRAAYTHDVHMNLLNPNHNPYGANNRYFVNLDGLKQGHKYSYEIVVTNGDTQTAWQLSDPDPLAGSFFTWSAPINPQASQTPTILKPEWTADHYSVTGQDFDFDGGKVRLNTGDPVFDVN